MKLSPNQEYLAIGTKQGELVICGALMFDLVSHTPLSQYAINNIEMSVYDGNIYIMTAFSSGQVIIYKIIKS